MILQVSEINKSFGKQRVLSDVSFIMDKPEIVALVGPNGSGKSTLLSIITNLIEADSGVISVLGQTNKNHTIFKKIAFMQDNTVLYDYLTGNDHLQFIADVQKLPKSQINTTAERIGITGYLHKKVGNYSLGMKQHLLLAMAILNKPELIILDEPLNGLDPTSAIKVRNLLIELKEEGATILLSSHNLSEIDKVTSKVMFLKQGRLIEEDMTLFEKISYQIKVDNPNLAEALLQEKNNVVKRNGAIISVELIHMQIQEILKLFAANDISILDMEKKVFGSEDRYRVIFESDAKNGAV
ncbi:putative ABC transporter ATP-binding protein YxlF [Bacillus sp. THAF10]|uniref:ABC transporter ATP-binding protein n=1 Tax=Bacillus sp. THAF10 TaxID=2587848 RepID=UPI001268A87C|nr:ATP-binding cassette domain-containing protein [Bacillus sp. THAF10]QFT87934.1 putative ABC transporter ATP-binding protein YxlF [Bacillus sp. THAF10]